MIRNLKKLYIAKIGEVKEINITGVDTLTSGYTVVRKTCDIKYNYSKTLFLTRKKALTKDVVYIDVFTNEKLEEVNDYYNSHCDILFSGYKEYDEADRVITSLEVLRPYLKPDEKLKDEIREERLEEILKAKEKVLRLTK